MSFTKLYNDGVHATSAHQRPFPNHGIRGTGVSVDVPWPAAVRVSGCACRVHLVLLQWLASG